MKCENCNIEHDGTYTSGRFCSVRCGKSFSTKNNRKSINSSISKTLIKRLDSGERIGFCKKSTKIKEYRKCFSCDSIFLVKDSNPDRKYCRYHTYRSKEYREKTSIIRINNIIDGKVEKFGKSRKCTYLFNGINIKCDSKLEWIGLQYMDKEIGVLSMERCVLSIPYIDFLGESRMFIPDFSITTNDEKIIMECKFEKLYYRLNEKWKNYIENSIAKKESLEKFCRENEYSMIWFTDKTSKNYRNFKIP